MFPHFRYEIDQFLFSAYRLTEGPALEDDAVRNCVYESFLIHARVLDEFFYSDNPKPDDLAASDFFEPGHWRKSRPQKLHVLDAVRTIVNKQLAHLTTARLNLTPSDPRAIASSIFLPLHRFLTALPEGALPDKNADIWKELVLAPSVRWLEVRGYLNVARMGPDGTLT